MSYYANWVEQVLRPKVWNARSRGFRDYDGTLCDVTHAAPWHPPSLIEALRRQTAAHPRETITVADFGCGLGVTLMGLANAAHAVGIDARFLGFDKGESPMERRVGCYFPDTPARLAAIMARFPEKIALPGQGVLDFPRPLYRRLDLDRDDWPCGPEQIDLAISRTAVMYLRDKLGFLERVYGSLRVGGLALIHLDEPDPSDIFSHDLRRIKLPDGMPFAALVDGVRRLGVEMTVSQRRGGIEVVVAMRKRKPGELRFGLQVRSSALDAPPEPFLRRQQPWGTCTVYGRADAG